MKYENKGKVDEICKDIKEKTEMLSSLKNYTRSICIVDALDRNIITINHEKFEFYGIGNPVRDLMEWHTNEIERLNKELESL